MVPSRPPCRSLRSRQLSLSRASQQRAHRFYQRRALPEAPLTRPGAPPVHAPHSCKLLAPHLRPALSPGRLLVHTRARYSTNLPTRVSKQTGTEGSLAFQSQTKELCIVAILQDRYSYTYNTIELLFPSHRFEPKFETRAKKKGSCHRRLWRRAPPDRWGNAAAPRARP